MKPFIRFSITFRVLFLAGLFGVLPVYLVAGSLTVGTKVIYPGGDTPKEKDTGISFKASSRGGTLPEHDTPVYNDTFYNHLIETDNLKKLESLLEGRNDIQAQWYHLRLLTKQGLQDEADELLSELEDSEELPENYEEILATDQQKGAEIKNIGSK